MSDEEKKVIEKSKRIIYMFNNCKNLNEVIIKLDIEELEILVDLIEKLKKPNYLYNAHTGEITRLDNSNYISKDKIDIKIEELQKDIKYSANPLSIDNAKFTIKVLQSLKEED